MYPPTLRSENTNGGMGVDIHLKGSDPTKEEFYTMGLGGIWSPAGAKKSSLHWIELAFFDQIPPRPFDLAHV